jgi:hypothetical protein
MLLDDLRGSQVGALVNDPNCCRTPRRTFGREGC